MQRVVFRGDYAGASSYAGTRWMCRRKNGRRERVESACGKSKNAAESPLMFDDVHSVCFVRSTARIKSHKYTEAQIKARRVFRLVLLRSHAAWLCLLREVFFSVNEHFYELAYACRPKLKKTKLEGKFQRTSLWSKLYCPLEAQVQQWFTKVCASPWFVCFALSCVCSFCDDRKAEACPCTQK